jgi:hypothetical protein
MSTSLRRLLLVATLVGIGLLAWAYLRTDNYTPTIQKEGGDDRPPIIISDGSVNFFIDAPGGSGGDWKAVTGTNEQSWYHDISVASQVNHFDVTLVNSKQGPPNSANCQDPGHVFSVTTFKVIYRGFLSGGTATVVIENGHFRVDFEDKAENDQNQPHKLISPGVLHLRKLKAVELPTGGPDVCTFSGGNDRAEIHVRQMQ